MTGSSAFASAPSATPVSAVISEEFLEQTLTSGPAHASASLGVAEAAQRIAIEAVSRRRARGSDSDVRATVRHLAAENSIDLSAARAIFGRALALVDEHYATHPTGYGTLAETSEVFAEVQRAKSFVNQAALRIVDRAMTVVGGGAYMNAHPLSRLYRDARAGAFMHPLGANVAAEYIGAVTLGITPEQL